MRQASGHLTTLWGFLLVAQGLLPIATVYLTRAIVNSLVVAIRSGGQWNALRPVIVLAAWIGAVVLATQILRGLTAWVRTAQSEMVRDHLAGLIQRKSLEVDLAFYDSSDFYDHLHRARMEATYRPIELLEGLGIAASGRHHARRHLGHPDTFRPAASAGDCSSARRQPFMSWSRWHIGGIAGTRAQPSIIGESWYYDTLLTDGEALLRCGCLTWAVISRRHSKRFGERLRAGTA